MGYTHGPLADRRMLLWLPIDVICDYITNISQPQLRQNFIFICLSCYLIVVKGMSMLNGVYAGGGRVDETHLDALVLKRSQNMQIDCISNMFFSERKNFWRIECDIEETRQRLSWFSCY